MEINQSFKAVELFCGIGGFRVAADGIGLNTIWANDFNPKSCNVYRMNFGKNELIEWDIRDLVRDVPNHNLLTGGFPCQPFSSAGKKQGIKDPRGTLFQSIVDILEKNSPEYFILENVKRLLHMEEGAHFATILSSLAELDYNIEWRLLNAMDFGLAQNRQRVFIIGSKNRALNGLTESLIKLARPNHFKNFSQMDLGVISTPTYWKSIEKHGRQFENWGLAKGGNFITRQLPHFQSVFPPTILSNVLEHDVAFEFDFTASTKMRIENSKPVCRFVDGVEVLSNQGGGARMGYTIFGINGVAPTLTASTSRHYERYKINNTYRRLTNIEYARLQGFPDNHCQVLSLYEQYEAFGNAVPPPMAQWVMEQVLTDGISLEETNAKQLALLD